MYELSATIEQEGVIFDMSIYNFKSFAEVVIYLEKYGEKLKFISYHIRRTEA